MNNPAGTAHRRWLLFAAAAYFLTFQMWMSWAVWQREGNMPPEPDDSYSYITGIELVARYGTPLPRLPGLPPEHALNIGMTHLSYNMALGLLSRLTGASPASVYHGSFFVGKIVLLGAFLFFFARARLKEEEQAASLAILAPYAGDPAMHGFYWVVPSFWMLVAFLVVAGIFLSERSRPMAALVGGFGAGVVFLATHPLSTWATAVLFLFVALTAWRSGGWRVYLPPRWGLLAGFAVGAVAMALLTILLPALLHVAEPSEALRAKVGTFVVPYSPMAPAGTIWQRIEPQLPSAWLLWTTYFRFLIAQPYILVVGWALVELWRQRRGALGLLWIATILGVLASARHPLGHRTVLFAWPLTLPLFAVGFLGAAERLRARYPRLRLALAVTLTVATLAASAATFAYNVPTVHSVARAVDVTWDPDCARDLLAMTDRSSIIEYSDKFALGAFRSHGLLERTWGSVQQYVADPTGGYFFIESPKAAVTREQVEQALGRPLVIVRPCGFFTILTARP